MSTLINRQQIIDEKAAKREAKLNLQNLDFVNNQEPVDCACVIHGTAYDWSYVEKLYNMLNRHISRGIRLHVYTEHWRPVPEPMIKHQLIDWGIEGPKKSWWYKMQLFNVDFHRGPMLYFDLDTVVVKNIDWIWRLSLRNFWSIRDFKYLWRPSNNGLNSSVMWWNTAQFGYVWKEAQARGVQALMQKYHGDQDFLSDVIPLNQRHFFHPDFIKSWRWQCKDGGYNFQRRSYKTPGAGTDIPDITSILIFHGQPKPGDIDDPVVIQHWQ